MNKIAIPTLLLGVVMIAGIFAFMPVQEASTVHTTAATAGLLVIGNDSAMNSATTCTSTADFTVDYVIAGTVNDETITIGGTAYATDAVITFDETANETSLDGTSGTVGGTAGETVTFTSSAATANGVFIMKTLSGATATCSG